MSITPLPPADFVPSIQGYSRQGAFRFWCQTVLPLVYDDSLSYYELLNKVVNYLNNLIKDTSTLEDNYQLLYEAFVLLQKYVNTYFDSLDVQEEINNKLDEMVCDGTFTRIVFDHIGYVTPEMFGAKGDGETDDSEAFQQAINTGKPVIVPAKSYLLSNTIIISESGTTLRGFSPERNKSHLIFSDCDGIQVKSNIRLIEISNIFLSNTNVTNIGIKITNTDIEEGSVHYLKIENISIDNFKYGIVGGGSTISEKDNVTYFWNCSFKQIKMNCINGECAFKIFNNNASNFGILLEEVTCIGYKQNINFAATTANFVSCNFGLNDCNAIYGETVSTFNFTSCNFECDSRVTNTGLAIINNSFVTNYSSCSFISYADNDVYFMAWGSSGKVTFADCIYKHRTGDEMNADHFYNPTISSPKYSVVYLHGNTDIPVISPYAARSLQANNIEKSIIPNRRFDIESDGSIGEHQFLNVSKKANVPIFYNGEEWKACSSYLQYINENIPNNSSIIINYMPNVKVPKTSFICVRSNNNLDYYLGLILKYRDNQLSTLIPLYTSETFTVTMLNNDITITNNTGRTTDIYTSINDLI